MVLYESGWGDSGEPPFHEIGAERLNPAYFAEVDRRVAYANSTGLVYVRGLQSPVTRRSRQAHGCVPASATRGPARSRICRRRAMQGEFSYSPPDRQDWVVVLTGAPR